MVPAGGNHGIGGADEVADAGDDVIPAESKGHDRSFLHKATHRWEEGHFRNVGVVLGENLVGKGHHFDAADFESLGFKAREDLADDVFSYCVGFEEDECGFLCHVVAGLCNWLVGVKPDMELVGEINVK